MTKERVVKVIQCGGCYLATQKERERIIKLLETNTPNNYGLTTLIMNWVVAEGADPTVQDCSNFAGEIIALIKAGE